MNPDEIIKKIKKRRELFKNIIQSKKGKTQLPPTCPACGYPTLIERGKNELCPICFWQDSGLDEKDADKIIKSPDGQITLNQYRIQIFHNLENFFTSIEKETMETFLLKQELSILNKLEDDLYSNITDIWKQKELIDQVNKVIKILTDFRMKNMQ